MSKKYTEKDLADILAGVEVEFQKHLQEEVTLSKAQPNETIEVEYDDEDKAELNKMYGSMTKSEAEIHLNALKAAINIEEMHKSESQEETKLLKSENETLKGENEELKKSLETVVASLKKMLIGEKSGPQRKAITEISVLNKTEENNTNSKDFSKLSSKEISNTLVEKIKGGELKKSDSDAVLKYYDTKNIELIKHLL